ncbi:phosphonate metabolism transcriptional regulator PhnF [Aureimonas leprariae]|uniref:Phosphonate metabolism transcriptional regulator PhnF n=1 Tax=Plantimonas leprariae TaxID=2615207 RepID=A0A7V7TV86_9HYPH|nr:phosphonate metabolism transcriptional regulator PhnF [Aureimonas leprariae]
MDEGVTRWRRVADRIRAAIAEGSMRERLAPETELAERFAVNRHTVRRAIRFLADEGLLRAERGRGTFVNAQPPRLAYPVGPRTRFSENVTAEGRTPGGRLIRAERASADAGLAAMLECPVGAALHRMETLHVANGVPLSVTTTFFPAKRFPGIVQAYAETGSITEALRLEGLPDYRRGETRVSAERIHPADAEHLASPPDAIVLVSTAIDVDPDRRPIQAKRARFHADRMELVFRF